MADQDGAQGDESVESRQRARGLERFLTFVDAVVAIAITLLVLPLVDVAGEVTSSRTDVAATLSHHGDQFLAFALSFVVISRLWFAQHAVLRPVVASSRRLSFLMMGWLLTIVVLPFTTALIAAAGSQAVVKVLYLGTMTVGACLMAAISTVVARDASLRDGEPSDPAAATLVAIILAVALVLALVVPAASYWPLLLLYLADPLAHRWRRWRGPLPAPSTPPG